jgi:predicted GH43/DUF377 family glycosyl hydrolase
MIGRFVKSDRNPILPAVPGTWMESQTANPDLLLVGDTYHLYFRGQQGGHDRIGVATIPREQFDGATWNLRMQPILDVGAPGDWDEQHVLDPATVLVNGVIHLYYSAVSKQCHRSICLATSTDGIHFEKFPGNPVVIGGGPEVVWREGRFHLYYWKAVPGTTGFQLHLSVSKDGYAFQEYQAAPVLSVGAQGEWDSYTVETPRIFEEGGRYCMFYCGSDRFSDYPAHAGLATSTDLVHWQKDARNPLFSRGHEGDWDEGAIWFTTVEKIGDRYYLWYEGYGGGDSRNKEYGSYLLGGKSQIGLAISKEDRSLSA